MTYNIYAYVAYEKGLRVNHSIYIYVRTFTNDILWVRQCMQFQGEDLQDLYWTLHHELYNCYID